MFQVQTIQDETHFYGNSVKPDAGTQIYNAWIVKEQQLAESIGDQESRNVIDSCEALNVSLSISNLKCSLDRNNGNCLGTEGEGAEIG